MKTWSAVLLLLLGAWLVSCQKDGANVAPGDEVSLADVSDAVMTAAARYAVAEDTAAAKKCRGKLTEVAVADLSQPVTAYISTTYTGSEVKYAAKDEAGMVIVAVKLADGSVVGLLFNADGSFKQELKPHLRKAKLTKIEISAMPAAVTTYVTSTYAGYTIVQAAQNGDGQYVVGAKLNDKIVVLLFNADGTFNKELTRPGKRHGKH